MSQRLCIYPDDVERITGRSLRQCREILKEIRDKHQKSKNQMVSYCELAAHLGLSPELVYNTINRLPVTHGGQEEE
ncbi:MAG TPA: hypothetical protein PLP62_14140 [Flavobacteriaceae bacterium]|nr:hypothetical protein [Alteromonas sp.]HPF12589.1 hypothetical protein [Flavobacteriaceae bacterium]